MTYSSRESDPPVLNATRARQGRWGRHMFWVLAVSTLLAVIGLFAAWSWRAPDLAATEPTEAAQQQQAQTFDTPQPPPPNPNAP